MKTNYEQLPPLVTKTKRFLSSPAKAPNVVPSGLRDINEKGRKRSSKLNARLRNFDEKTRSQRGGEGFIK